METLSPSKAFSIELFIGIQARSLGLVAAVIADAGRTQIAAGSKTVILNYLDLLPATDQ